MDEYMGSHKLATYLHPGPGGPFLELKNEPTKPPSPVTTALLHHNPSLIDLCTFNSLCERFMENNPSSNTSTFKPLVTPSDLYFCLPPVNKIAENQTSHDVTTKLNILPDTTNSPLSSVGDCSPNVSSYHSTPYSSPKVKQIIDSHSSSATTQISDKKNQNGDDNPPSGSDQCQSIDHVAEIEQVLMNNLSSSQIDRTWFSSPVKVLHTSPILHRLLTSPTNSDETSLSNVKNNSLNNNTSKSPFYQPRYSTSYVSKNSDNSTGPTKNVSKVSKSKRVTNRTRNSSHQSVKKEQIHIEQGLISSECETLTQHDSLLSSDSPGNFNGEHQHTTDTLTNKRILENFEIDELQRKRRCSDTDSIVTIQQDYCISYSNNIPRCIDCQTASPADFALHQAGCRFQQCRKLKKTADGNYQFEGFTQSLDASDQDVSILATPNSSDQCALNSIDANYIFTRIAKLFCLMFLQEQAERKKHNDQTIIWRRYMPGWREVCDECSTTLFNHHYICRECGYMICIECSDQFSQWNVEKRKKMKRLCLHENSFLLAEFIPWNLLLNLRNDSANLLSRMKFDYTIKLYPGSKTENLSPFIKSLKMKRNQDARDVQKVWSSKDCNEDPNIEFYCGGRLPVFNEWTSDNAKQFFRKVWSNSAPVLVKQVHKNLSPILWQPSSFKDHMIDHQETPALWDCETLTPIRTDQEILTKFWDGFERLDVRLKDDEHDGRPRILKLKDWPTKKDFASVFPSRLHDLMANIPFSDYTRRSYVFNGVTYPGGVLNIVERLPCYLVKPDLGPKLYIAYSQLTSQATKKAGTTNLHIDVSDAVNVLVYVGVGGHGEDGSLNDNEIKQVEAEILDSNIDSAQLQRLRNGERPGALWHLFRSDDAKTIRKYIGRKDRRTPGSDTIHDQSAYLEKEDLEKLRDWSNVESFPILQFLGDAVFIPSGAPHQVKNLHSCIKIAEDFVSPENLDRCLITTNEFRALSKTHTNHADILQAKNILYYSTRDALNSLTESNYEK